ncbi:hypothetical protein BJ138DRAFT_1143693 [Hygrophoropsis aurantiaca]|uniref:Uncharacterized protein n=1 Tax=Hygrophoropsis aurantiaca TaxID=72124 RepID=A0ACB8ANQ2_9AGAM|nr:hypothetical protein BJ138DRAFT_1143693 [Hygrophoropsis aurantiaca]
MSDPDHPMSFSLELFNIGFISANMCSLLYGAYIIIAMQNIYRLQARRKAIYRLWVGYTAVALAVTTIYFGVSTNFASSQLSAVIVQPGANATSALSLWYEIVTDATFVINTWLADAFILYRCHVIWRGNKYAVAGPAILYLASIGVSIAFLWASAHPGSVYTTASVLAFAVPYWTCSVALNILASLLIAIRLLVYRRLLVQSIGPQHGKPYTTYIAMTVESAALYSVFGIIVLVTFALNNQLENAFLPILGIIQVLAPAIIISRIANGTSFDSHDYQSTIAPLAALRFADGPSSAATSRYVDSDLSATSTAQLPFHSQSNVNINEKKGAM